jgi:hypothetical protein
MTRDANRDTPWIKSRLSSQQGACVEMRSADGGVEVRDSKHPDGPTLRYTKAEFAAWLDGAKKGQFDHLAG